MSDTLRVRCPNCNATGQEHVHSGEMYAGSLTCKLCNGERYVRWRKGEAMSDTPDVLDAIDMVRPERRHVEVTVRRDDGSTTVYEVRRG